MSDTPKLKDLLIQNHQCVEMIYDHYKREGDAEPPRGYLGASIIGHACERHLWYTFRAATKEDFPGRIYRLFETGDLEEIRVVKDLRAIGCTVHDVDPNTGQQFEVNAYSGHFSGHMDGCLLGLPGAEKTWHVCEFKTAKEKLFKALVAAGVKVKYPKHYAQMQVYMHLTGMTRAIYVCVCKDTDEIWAERVYYDEEFAKGLMLKARRIITAKEPPSRITERRDWWECKFCSSYDICWGTGDVVLPVPAVNCRQCCHSTPVTDGNGRWICEKHSRGLSMNDQQSACEDHLILPGLLAGYEPTDYAIATHGNECITFTHRDTGDSWTHGKLPGQYTSSEAAALSASAIVSSFLAEAKACFGATATGSYEDDILTRYPKEDSVSVWSGPERQLADKWCEIYAEDLVDLLPSARFDGLDYRAVEFKSDGRDRVVIVWTENNVAEIREGKE